jgi:hypothetical protein
MFPSACSFILLVFKSLTTRFGLHGHLQADKHTCKEPTKLTKENSSEKHKWKRAECDVKKRAEKKQRSRILQAHENKNILRA